MAGFTEKAIKETFLELLDEKPYNQITVKDIVEACGINRNSFYYHFADIPSLVDVIIEDEIMRLMQDPGMYQSPQESLAAALSFAKEHKRAVYHLYKSANRDSFERYLMKNCDLVVTRYVDTILEGQEVTDNDRRLIINYFKYLCFGTCIDWLESGMTLDLEGDFARICEMLVDPALESAGIGKPLLSESK